MNKCIWQNWWHSEKNRKLSHHLACHTSEKKKQESNCKPAKEPTQKIQNLFCTGGVNTGEFFSYFFFFRRKLQIIPSPGPPGGPGSPALPLHHPPLARGAHCHNPDLHHLLPVCGSAPGQINHAHHCSLEPEVNLTHTVGVQVVVLLYMATVMVPWLWRRGLDPDNFSIPYLTALGDLLGTGLLALSFRLILVISSTGTSVWRRGLGQGEGPGGNAKWLTCCTREIIHGDVEINLNRRRDSWKHIGFVCF